jgi:hypothetical protein
MTPTHTPTPWRVVPTTVKGAGTKRRDIVTDSGEFSPAFVAGDVDEHDAELIVRAVNSHAALVEALRDMLNDAETMNAPYRNEAFCEAARAALEKAGAL